MSVKSGFFNSVNRDRLYPADDFSKIFDGIIRDGVYMHIGNALAVTSSSGMSINVGIGRAWFNGTWTYNDALLPLTVSDADVILNRIDAVVLEVDSTEAIRNNSIKVITGIPATNPVRPTLIHNTLKNQYALAYITVPVGATSLTQANITSVVGTTETPYVISPLTVLTANAVYSQWEAEFDSFMETSSQNDENWRTQKQQEFQNWYTSLQTALEGDVAANLANQISTLNNTVTNNYNTLNTDANRIATTSVAGNVKIGNGLYGDSTTGKLDVVPASTVELGGIIIGNELTTDIYGKLSVKKSTPINVTVLAANWTGSKPYYNEVDVTGVTATSLQSIIPSTSMTESQYDMFAAGKIFGYSQDTNKITLIALGDKPTTDIPITVIRKGEK